MADVTRLERATERSVIAAWRYCILVGIANFVELRRHLGQVRSRRLADDLAVRCVTALPGADVAIRGHDLIELTLDASSRDDLDDALRRLRVACAAPFDPAGECVSIEIETGAAAMPSETIDAVRLIEEAEAALAKARRRHLAMTRRFDERQDDEIALAEELRTAIAHDQLVLHYQPKIHVRRHAIASVEALVRWQHPARGLIPPNDFIAAAEQARLIGEMTLWVIRRAIDDQRLLAARGHDLTVFVNISGQLLGDPGFVQAACRLVAEAEARLGFEVTETSVIRDPDSAIANLHVFSDIGITISIDDYGAGLSSLAYLKQLPARELKIDKLFVTQLTSSNRDPLIVRSTIDLAHALDMEVVAEGVESHAALALLTVMGCDMVQGFLISRPVALEALVRFLDDDSQRLSPERALASFTKLAQVWKK